MSQLIEIIRTLVFEAYFGNRKKYLIHSQSKRRINQRLSLLKEQSTELLCSSKIYGPKSKILINLLFNSMLRSQSRNYLFYKYFLQSDLRMLGWRKPSIDTYDYFLWHFYYIVMNSFKWQYMAGAGAGAEIIDKSGAGAENK